MKVEEIKKDFPLLENSKIAYLDSGATTQKPNKVIEKVEEFYKKFHFFVLLVIYYSLFFSYNIQILYELLSLLL